MTRRPNGFTLLEVLCAGTLSTLLMVAVLGVVAGLAKNEIKLAGRDPTTDWERRLAARLARDLGATKQIEAICGGVRLTGPLGRDPRSGVATWTEAAVDYVVVDSPLGATLLRRESPAALGAETRYEVLSHRVTTLVMTLPTEPMPVIAGDRMAFVTIPTGSPPPALRVVLLDTAESVLFDRNITSP